MAKKETEKETNLTKDYLTESKRKNQEKFCKEENVCNYNLFITTENDLHFSFIGSNQTLCVMSKSCTLPYAI